MIPYYIMISVPVLIYMLYGGTNQYLNNEKKQKATLWAFFAILFLILALRHKSVGCDLPAYLSRFDSIRNFSFSQIFNAFEGERGYWTLNKLIGLFTSNKQIFITLMAIITLFPIARLYLKQSENALLTISIFLILPNFAMMFSGLRQAIAIALVAASFKYVKEKKLIGFIIIILLAMTFHTSAFIAFILYPLYHINITRNKFLASIPFIVAVFVYNKPVFEFLLEIMGEFGEQYEYEKTSAYTMIVLFALFVVFAYIAPQREQMDKNSIGLRNISILCLILQIFALANPIAMRMNYYFIIFLPILIPKMINRCSKTNRQILTYIGFIMALFFFVYYINSMNQGVDTLQLYPYKPFWK